MERVECVLKVNAPAAAVVAYLKKPENLMHMWPGTTSIYNVEGVSRDTTRFRWTRTFLGTHFQGRGQTSVSPNFSEVTISILGGLTCTMIWHVQKHDAVVTEVKLELISKPPLPLRHRGADNRFGAECDGEAHALLENLAREFKPVEPAATSDVASDDSTMTA